MPHYCSLPPNSEWFGANVLNRQYCQVCAVMYCEIRLNSQYCRSSLVSIQFQYCKTLQFRIVRWCIDLTSRQVLLSPGNCSSSNDDQLWTHFAIWPIKKTLCNLLLQILHRNLASFRYRSCFHTDSQPHIDSVSYLFNFHHTICIPADKNCGLWNPYWRAETDQLKRGRCFFLKIETGRC